MNPQRSRALIPRNRYLLVAAAVALCVSVAQLADLVELPFGAVFGGSSASVLSTASLVSFMSSLGYVSLFALMTLESASVPIPSEVVLPFAGYLVYSGVMNFALALLVSTVASLAGALVDYYLAFFLGRPFVVSMLKGFRVNPRALDRAEGWFERSGQWTVLVSRFVPVLRSVISLPAGLFRMRLAPFVAMTVAGCLAWSAVLTYAGYAAGKLWDSVFSSSITVVDGFSLVIAAVAGAYVVCFAIGGGKGDARSGLPGDESPTLVTPASSVS
jgi:membrane protein DedA with SNARE-associated domain